MRQLVARVRQLVARVRQLVAETIGGEGETIEGETIGGEKPPWGGLIRVGGVTGVKLCWGGGSLVLVAWM